MCACATMRGRNPPQACGGEISGQSPNLSFWLKNKLRIRTNFAVWVSRAAHAHATHRLNPSLTALRQDPAHFGATLSLSGFRTLLSPLYLRIRRPRRLSWPEGLEDYLGRPVGERARVRARADGATAFKPHRSNELGLRRLTSSPPSRQPSGRHGAPPFSTRRRPVRVMVAAAAAARRRCVGATTGRRRPAMLWRTSRGGRG
jgi:hypothetical protein